MQYIGLKEFSKPRYITRPSALTASRPPTKVNNSQSVLIEVGEKFLVGWGGCDNKKTSFPHVLQVHVGKFPKLRCQDQERGSTVF